MKTNEINIRDPFLLPHDGKYYMYGTRGETAFTKEADGFDVYVGTDLENWDGPFEIFHRPADFWAVKYFWAPEVHEYNGSYYLFATFSAKDDHQGTAILRAEKPEGPFIPWSDGPITPWDWRCLDGTFYRAKDGTPYMVFCHEWKQVHDGTVCAVRLTDDLKSAVGEPRTLFAASAGRPAIRPFLFKNFVTDGPFFLRTEDGRLHLLWSSFGKGGYVQALAYSDNDDIDGHWHVDQRLLFTKDGGHGMIFRTFAGDYMLTLHSPNRSKKERPVFTRLTYENGTLQRS